MCAYWILVSVLVMLISPAAFAQQSQQSGITRAELQSLREEISKIKSENDKKTSELENKITDLENKLSTYEEKSLSQGSSPQMGDKEKIAYMAKKKNIPIGTYLGVMNPDISVVLDSNSYFTRDKSSPDRNKVKIREGEVALQGNLYPGIRGDFFVTYEQEYEADGSVNGKVDLEAGSIRFMDLPLDLNAQIGRMFVEFGEMNKIHQHHRSTVDQPLVLEHFFGNHSWIDEGVQISALLPNPFDLYWKVEGSYLNGRPLKLHEDEHGGEGDEKPGHAPIPFNDKIVMLRTFINFPFDEDNSKDLNASYSLAFQDGGNIKLHGIGIDFKYRVPYSFKVFSWRNEALLYENKLLKIRRGGGYSQLKLKWNAYWSFGGRFDWSEFTDKDKGHSTSASLFTTYNFTETTYTRVQYRYRQEQNSRKFNEVFLQLVWGIGPHSHRLED